YAPVALLYKRKTNLLSLSIDKKEWLLGISTFVFSVCFYLPVYLTYGLNFFSHANPPYPIIEKILFNASFRLWGVLGLCLIIILIFAHYNKIKKASIIPEILGIALTILVFIRFPF